jgi:hypothetical protein
MPRSRRDALQSVLLVIAVLAGLVAVRWAVTGGPGRSLAPPALTSAPTRPDRGPAPRIVAPPRARLSLGGRQPILVSPATGTVTPLPFNPQTTRTVLFRQGAHTVFVSDERAWAAPAGRAAPLRPLGRALAVLPALVDDRVWLVDARYGEPEAQLYELVEVGLADGRTHTRWTLPYQAAPVAILPSGVLARDPEDNLQVVAPGSGRVRAVLAKAATFVDARGGRVAWVEGRDLHVRDLKTGNDTVVPPPPGSPDWYALGGPVPRVACCYGLGAFDPAGRRLAIYTRLAGPGAPGLAVVDLVRGSAALLAGSEDATPTGCLPCLGWSTNGWLYFFAAGPDATSIGAWGGGAAPAGLLPLDLDEVLDSVPSALAAN